MASPSNRTPDGTKPGDDVLMMKNPDLWPTRNALGGMLMLQRNREKFPETDLGIMVQGPEVPRTAVFFLSMFDPRLREVLRGEFDGIPHKVYDDFEAIVDDGWRVD